MTLQLDHIECADALTYLRSLPDECVNCIVTSPPYFGLRDYGTAKWDGGDPACDHAVGRFTTPASEKQMSNTCSGTQQARNVCPKCGAKHTDTQIGLEPSPAEYVAALVAVFREAKRVLRSDGTCWINLGDSYSGSGKGRNADGSHQEGGKQGTNFGTMTGLLNKTETDLPPKSLLGIPWRVAFALQDDGWILRSDIIWAKNNPMPESVQDRCTRSHEYIFHFTKQARYWYDKEAVSEPTSEVTFARAMRGVGAGHKNVEGAPGQTPHSLAAPRQHGEGYPTSPIRNRRSVWTINPASYKGAHFATMPEEIPEICIKAACPEWCCDQCGAPYEAQVEVERRPTRPGTHTKGNGDRNDAGNPFRPERITTLTGYAPACSCNAGKRAGVVLDMFAGAGTVALVAKRLNRRYLGCDLNASYVAMARARIDSIPYTLFSLMEAGD